MNSLQRVIYLAIIDGGFRVALQTDLAAALTRQGFTLSSEEMGILRDLQDVLSLPARSLADIFQRGYLGRPCWD